MSSKNVTCTFEDAGVACDTPAVWGIVIVPRALSLGFQYKDPMANLI